MVSWVAGVQAIADGPRANANTHVDTVVTNNANVSAAPDNSKAQSGATASVKTCAAVAVEIDAQVCARLLAELRKVNAQKANSNSTTNAFAQIAANLDPQVCLKISAALNKNEKPQRAPALTTNLDVKVDALPNQPSANVAVVNVSLGSASSLPAKVEGAASANASTTIDTVTMPLTTTTNLSIHASTNAALTPGSLNVGIELH